MKRLPDLKHVRVSSDEPEAPAAEPTAEPAKVTAIIKVLEDGYVPPHTEVRARIDERMFTANVHASNLDDVKADPKVASVEASIRLRQIG